MSKLNLNKYVKVKLNEKGIEIFESFVKKQLSYKKVNMLTLVDYMNRTYQIKDVSRGSEITQIIITIQLWEFMSMFNNIAGCMGSNTPFDMNIEINDNDLIKEENQQWN